MKFLSQSERDLLIKMLNKHKDIINEQQDNGFKVDIDERHTESDSHLVFEALHVLAANNPEKLYSMVHARGLLDHPEANAGKTFLMIEKISNNGAQVYL